MSWITSIKRKRDKEYDWVKDSMTNHASNSSLMSFLSLAVTSPMWSNKRQHEKVKTLKEDKLD